MSIVFNGHTVAGAPPPSDTANAAKKADLTSIIATGATNATGATITSGTYFYLNGSLVVAKADIASGATFTENTNYEAVTAGGLNSLKSAIPIFYSGISENLHTQGNTEYAFNIYFGKTFASAPTVVATPICDYGYAGYMIGHIKEIKTNPYYILKTFIINFKENLGLKLNDEIDNIKLTELPISDRYSSGTNITKKEIIDVFEIKELESKEENTKKVIEKENINLETIDQKMMTIDDFLKDL